MGSTIDGLILTAFRWARRDRIFHGVAIGALLLFILVPILSSFSMRQVQELGITLSLSTVSVILLLLSTLAGSSSLLRDIERRYTSSVLGLPISRASFVIGKFLGIAALLACCATFLALVSHVVILVSAAQYTTDRPILWVNIHASILFDCLKYILLAAVALLFSSVSTSFFLPIFGTIAVYVAGSGTQEVIEFISGDYGKTLSPLAKGMIRGAYYLLPNFTAFNLKVQAIYSLPLDTRTLLFTFVYFIIYTSIVLLVAVQIFSRREL